MINKTLPLYFLLLLGSMNLFSCSETDELANLKLRIDGLVTASENHNGKEIQEFLAKDFSSMKGMNKAQFYLFTRHYFKRYKNVSVTVISKDITLNENKKQADVTGKVLLLGSNEWLPERGQLYQVASRWKKESGDWVMSRLRWEKELN